MTSTSNWLETPLHDCYYAGCPASYSSINFYQSYKHHAEVPLQTMPHPASPPEEAEDEQPGHNNRRRVTIACMRCRKRKIKCSGEGDGRYVSSNSQQI